MGRSTRGEAGPPRDSHISPFFQTLRDPPHPGDRFRCGGSRLPEAPNKQFSRSGDMCPYLNLLCARRG